MQRSFSRSRQAHQSLWQRFDEQPGLIGSALSLFLESLAPEVLELLAQATSSVIKMLTALPVKGILPKLNKSIRIVAADFENQLFDVCRKRMKTVDDQVCERVIMYPSIRHGSLAGALGEC